MKFVYDAMNGFTEEKFNELKADTEREDAYMCSGSFYGSIRVGNLAFDIRLHMLDGDDYVDGDLYVGDISEELADGYGDDGTAYGFAGDGADIPLKEFKELKTYDEFKARFEEEAKACIERQDKEFGTIAKANEPLRVW